MIQNLYLTSTTKNIWFSFFFYLGERDVQLLWMCATSLFVKLYFSKVQCWFTISGVIAESVFPRGVLLNLTCFLLGIFLFASATRQVPGIAGVLQWDQHSWEQQRTFTTTLSLWPLHLIPCHGSNKPGTVPVPLHIYCKTLSVSPATSWAKTLLPQQEGYIPSGDAAALVLHS